MLHGFEVGDTPTLAGDGTPFVTSARERHNDSYVYFSCSFLFVSDNIHFSMSTSDYAGYNHSEFREIILLVF